MHSPGERAWSFSLWLMTALGAAGLAWRECLLAAATLVLAHRLFLWRMEVGAPWDGFRLGVRCIFTGVIGLAASAALAAIAVAGLADLLAMSHGNASAAILAMGLSGLLVIAVQMSAARRRAEFWFGLGLIALAVLAYSASDAGHVAIPCALTLASAVYLFRVNWQTARAGAEAFLACRSR